MKNSFKSDKKSIAVIGSGPAGLMAADIISQAGHSVSVFERNKGPGFKLLIAGSSGLNIGNDYELAKFIQFLIGPPSHFNAMFSQFFTKEWIEFIESLGLKTFLGSSGKYFVKEMKSARLLQVWVEKLKNQNTDFFYNKELVDIAQFNSNHKIELTFSDSSKKFFDGVVLAMGGGSWLKEKSPTWIKLMSDLELKVTPLQASNCGYEVSWPKKFLEESEGKPLKGVLFRSKKGEKFGDITITNYGLEGTPIYFYGTIGSCFIDLLPHLTQKQIHLKCSKSREKLAPLRLFKKHLALSKTALSILFHMTDKQIHTELEYMIEKIKSLEINLILPRPLSEAISSSGGLCFSELNDNLMIKKVPGVFAAGEMLDWDAPTGGFLVQTCVSQGYVAGKGVLHFLK